MLTTIAIAMMVVGILGILGLTILVNNNIYVARLSMNIFGGATKEHHQGLSWKLPWCPIQPPGRINMKAEIIITSGGIFVMPWEQFMAQKVYKNIDPRVYETEDGLLFGSWATAIRPLKGELANFILKTPQVGSLMTMARIDLEISDHLATKKTKEVLGQKREVSDKLAAVFGGEDSTTPFEQSYGISVANPSLFDLNYGERSQLATEKLFEAIQFRSAMEELATQIEDPDKRTNAILIATGMAKKNVFNVEGLDTALIGIAKVFASRGG